MPGSRPARAVRAHPTSWNTITAPWMAPDWETTGAVESSMMISVPSVRNSMVPRGRRIVCPVAIACRTGCSSRSRVVSSCSVISAVIGVPRADCGVAAISRMAAVFRYRTLPWASVPMTPSAIASRIPRSLLENCRAARRSTAAAMRVWNTSSSICQLAVSSTIMVRCEVLFAPASSGSRIAGEYSSARMAMGIVSKAMASASTACSGAQPSRRGFSRIRSG